MKPMQSNRLGFVLALAVGMLALGGCGAEAAEDGALPEGMGAVVASLSEVPSDTRCVVLRAYDSRRSFEVAKDVTPGAPASIRLAPISPGYVSIQGEAYSVPCASRWNTPDTGVASYMTWQADSIGINVTAGTDNQAKLIFRHLSQVNVEIEFRDGDSGPIDAGPVEPQCGWALDAGTWCL